MMTGKVVTTYSNPAVSTNNTSAENGTLISDVSHQYSPMEVATVVTFTVAVIQVTRAQFTAVDAFLRGLFSPTYLFLHSLFFIR